MTLLAAEVRVRQGVQRGEGSWQLAFFLFPHFSLAAVLIGIRSTFRWVFEPRFELSGKKEKSLVRERKIEAIDS